MKKIELSEDYAIVMQQIEEVGEEDFDNLAETLKFDNSQLLDIVRGLQHKGLIILRYSQQGLWLQPSIKGKKIANLIWPEIHHLHYLT